MSMTREEAIIELKNMLAFLQNEDGENLPEFLEAVDLATRALHPVSRERVEKVWRGEWERITDPYGKLEGFLCKCGTQTYSASKFCPSCGAPMTDEAVQMVMERLDELHD